MHEMCSKVPLATMATPRKPTEAAISRRAEACYGRSRTEQVSAAPDIACF